MTFKPMLSGKTPDDLATLTYPMLASPKLDGIRCVILDGVATSRRLKPIPNDYVRAQLADAVDGLDGELMVPGGFNACQSAFMSKDGEPDFTFWVFDWYGIEEGFAARYDYLTEELPEHPRIRIVPHQIVEGPEDVLELERRFLAEGYEGVMLRSLTGPYKLGRSTTREQYLLKHKQFLDEEATILACIERMHNENEATTNALGLTERSSAKEGKRPAGDLGAFACRTKAGVEFQIGSGFTEAQRKDFWTRRAELVGQLVTFKHQPDPDAAEGAAPRFPVFLGIRRDL